MLLAAVLVALGALVWLVRMLGEPENGQDQTVSWLLLGVLVIAAAAAAMVGWRLYVRAHADAERDIRRSGPRGRREIRGDGGEPPSG